MNEGSVILAIQAALGSDAGRALVGFASRWVIYAFVPFLLFIRFLKGMQHAVMEALWSAAVAFALSTTLSVIIARVRPYKAVPGVEAIVPPNMQAGSLPSSHTAVVFAIAAAIAFKDVPLGIAAFLMALLVAFGRVASGMHYPSDVAAGAAVGIGAFFLVRLGHVALQSVK